MELSTHCSNLCEQTTPNYVKRTTSFAIELFAIVLLNMLNYYLFYRAEGIEETFIVVAQFAKCTPGFKSLSLDDQITLIKGEVCVYDSP